MPSCFHPGQGVPSTLAHSLFNATQLMVLFFQWLPTHSAATAVTRSARTHSHKAAALCQAPWLAIICSVWCTAGEHALGSSCMVYNRSCGVVMWCTAGEHALCSSCSVWCTTGHVVWSCGVVMWCTTGEHALVSALLKHSSEVNMPWSLRSSSTPLR